MTPGCSAIEFGVQCSSLAKRHKIDSAFFFFLSWRAGLACFVALGRGELGVAAGLVFVLDHSVALGIILTHSLLRHGVACPFECVRRMVFSAVVLAQLVLRSCVASLGGLLEVPHCQCSALRLPRKAFQMHRPLTYGSALSYTLSTMPCPAGLPSAVRMSPYLSIARAFPCSAADANKILACA